MRWTSLIVSTLTRDWRMGAKFRGLISMLVRLLKRFRKKDLQGLTTRSTIKRKSDRYFLRNTWLKAKSREYQHENKWIAKTTIILISPCPPIFKGRLERLKSCTIINHRVWGIFSSLESDYETFQHCRGFIGACLASWCPHNRRLASVTARLSFDWMSNIVLELYLHIFSNF